MCFYFIFFVIFFQNYLLIADLNSLLPYSFTVEIV